MKQTKWFDRQFALIPDNGLLPDILERLEGTPARLSYKISKMNPEHVQAPGLNGWSIKKEIGHLIDLEPLWFERMQQLIQNDPNLIPADLSNRKTHETDHDAKQADELIAAFKSQRDQLVQLLRQVNDTALENTALHPRLKTPMRIIDLAYFVAEHDDHHLAKITALSHPDE